MYYKMAAPWLVWDGDDQPCDGTRSPADEERRGSTPQERGMNGGSEIREDGALLIAAGVDDGLEVCQAPRKMTPSRH